jgi:hypothetical protein
VRPEGLEELKNSFDLIGNRTSELPAIPIKMDFSEVGYEYVDWVHVSDDRGLWQSQRTNVMKFRKLLVSPEIGYKYE